MVLFKIWLTKLRPEETELVPPFYIVEKNKITVGTSPTVFLFKNKRKLRKLTISGKLKKNQII
jgi:hypothetical protein